MNDSTTDEKIAQLVRSVLEAVDVRLSEVRRELEVAGQEADRRHLEVQQELRDLSVRLDRIDSAQRRGSAAHDLVEQQVAELRTGLARLHQRVEHDTPLAPTRPSVASVAAPAPAVPQAAPVVTPAVASAQPAPMAPVAAPPERAPVAQPAPVLPALDRVAAPLVTPHLAVPPITTEIPRINFDTDITTEMPTLELRTATPSAANPSVADTAPAAASEPGIDLDQLANLLSERLGHLHLPPAQSE